MSENKENELRAAAAEAEQNYKDSRKLETNSRADVKAKLALAEEAWFVFKARQGELDEYLASLDVVRGGVVSLPESLTVVIEEKIKSMPEARPFIERHAAIIYEEKLQVLNGDTEAAAQEMEAALDDIIEKYKKREEEAMIKQPRAAGGWTGNH